MAESPDQQRSFEALVRQYVSSLPFSLDFQGVEAELGDLAAAYGGPGGACFLALAGGEPVGCAALRFLEEGVGELKRMYVVPTARQQGHGRALCAAVIAEARRLGYRKLRLDTVAAMTEAGKLYETMGFEPIPPYRENPLESARFYELDLSGLPARS